MNFTKVEKGWYASSDNGVRVDIVESGIAEGEKKPKWIIRINNEVVDAADTLHEAKKLAETCCKN